MKSLLLLLTAALLAAGCAKPPEQVYNHPKTGKEHLAEHLGECRELAEKFGFINMSPVHQYPMDDMRDGFQRGKVFDYCMRKKGYERGDIAAVGIDASNTRILVVDTVLTTGESTLVRISFPSAVGGLENSDLTVENASLSPLTTDDNGLTWTAMLTPVPDVSAPHNVIRLNNAGVIDAVSNPGRGITVSNSYAVNSRGSLVAATGTAADTAY